MFTTRTLWGIAMFTKSYLLNTIIILFLGLLIMASLTGCDNNKDQQRAWADANARNINYIYDTRTNFCFAILSSGISFVPCDKIPQNLIPNYPKTELKALENMCRFEAVLQQFNNLKI